MSTKETKARAFVSTFAILGSRILGLIREQIFAFFFGASAVFDAYLAAFRIPSLLRDLAAEGALSQSFVAIFSQKLAKESKDEAFKLAHKVSTFIVLFMGVTTVLGIIFAPYLVKFVAIGFTGAKYDLTVQLTQILFPYILFVSLSALMMGMLHSLGKFFIPHSASTVFNFMSITLGLLCAFLFSTEYMQSLYLSSSSGAPLPTFTPEQVARAIQGMALGTVLGGVFQYFFQYPTAIKQGFRPRFDFDLRDAGLKKVLALTAPAIIGGAAVQVNVIINTQFASILADGSVSYLGYAFRFMQFPLGVFGVAIATASAPTLSKMVVHGQTKDFIKTIQSSIKLSLFLSLPSMLGLVVIGKHLIALIYQHGQFTTSDTHQTALALMAYSLGIASYSLIKIYQPAFLAYHNAKTPMRVSLISIFVNAGINALFIFVMGWSHWALALGTAIVALINIVLLSYLFGQHLKGIWTKEVWVGLLKTIVASVIMGGVTYLFVSWLEFYLNTGSLIDRAGLVFIPVFVAVLVYFFVSTLLGIDDAKYVVNKFARRR